MAFTLGALEIPLETAAYSCFENPATLAMIGRFGYSLCNQGNFSERTASSPGFCRPIAFSIPAGVSATRGVGLPKRGSRVVALIMIDPKRSKS